MLRGLRAKKNKQNGVGNSVSVISVTSKFEASDSDDGSENILDKSCVEDASDMSDEDFPLDG